MNEHVMNEPIGETRLDRNTQGVIGKGVDRYEGKLKVSGKAPYAYEHLIGEEVTYGFVVPGPVGRARVRSINTSRAMAEPGVLAVVTGDGLLRSSAQPMSPAGQTMDGEIFHYNQPIALVVAESFEIARHASHLVKVDYEEIAGRYEIESRRGTGRATEEGPMAADTNRGDFEKAGVVFSGLSPDGTLVEMVELPGHPFFLGCQFHPELKSRPNRPHPLFVRFVAEALAHQGQGDAAKVGEAR